MLESSYENQTWQSAASWVGLCSEANLVRQCGEAVAFSDEHQEYTKNDLLPEVITDHTAIVETVDQIKTKQYRTLTYLYLIQIQFMSA